MKKKTRKCSVCESTEHRADHHGKKAERQKAVTALVELTGDAAIKALIIPDYALYIVLSDQVGTAIAGAVNNNDNSHRSMAMISAFSKLAERAAKLDRKTLTTARSAWQQLQQAQDAYAKAVEPVKAVIIPEGKS